MQVERERLFGAEYSGERVSNTWATCPRERDNPRKLGLYRIIRTVISPYGKW